MVRCLDKSFLTGKVTFLQEIKEEDYPKIVNWINDPKFNKFLYQGWEKVTIKDFARQVEGERLEEEAKIFSQFNNKSLELVGWCGIYLPKSLRQRNANKAEIRSFVGTEYWGNGYGTEQYILLVRIGFELLNFNRMYFGTHQDNKGTQGIYEKLGFIREGILREDYRRTEYADIYQYAVLKSEYEASIKKNFSEYLQG